MEKESFHEAPGADAPDSVTDNDIQEFVSQLPVPNQLPQTPDLSHLPADILRSSTVETLIHQNEDLLSRLSLSLRRNSSLEENICQLEKKNRILAHKHSNLEDQIYVYKKKDDLIEGKYTKYEERISELKKDLKLFETQYTELYSTSQSRVADFKSRLALFSKRIGRYSRFKKRAIRIYKELKASHLELRQDHSRLLTEVATLTETGKAMKKNMAAAVERIQQMEKDHQRALAELTSSYEDQLQDKQKTTEIQSQEISALTDDLEKAKKVYESNVELENQVVHLERKISDQKAGFSTEIEELQAQLQEQRQLAKQKVLEVHTLEEQISEAREVRDVTLNENQRLTDQVESLQTLWRNNNEKLESLQQKYTSLQKLNQQISITLNDTRKALQNERDQKETLNFRTKDKIDQLESQVHLLSTQVREDSGSTELSRIKPQVIDHLQSLIAEVQSGVETAPSLSSSEAGPTEETIAPSPEA